MRLPITAVAMLVVSGLSCTPFAGGVTPRVERGRLSVSYATLGGTQFDSLINSIHWVDGHTRQRCTNALCTASVPVQIDANETSFVIDSVNPGVHGVLVARVRNMGSDSTYMYHFRPAPYRYYFLVKRYVGGPTRWILLRHMPGTAPDSVDSGPFRGCFDHPPATAARADFKNCDPPMTRRVGQSRVTSFASTNALLPAARTLQAVAEAGGWIGCAYGCCPVAY